MKKQFWQTAVLLLMLAIILCACGTAPENEDEETATPTESIVETTEPEMEPDPEWLSDAAIDEAYAYLFPLNGEKNVELAQEILLPLVEAGNAEAQYYWGYIYDWEIVDNNGEEEKESLYWHTLALEQGFAKSCLAAALNTYIESEKRANELVDMAQQLGLFEMSPEELRADGCELIGSYYYHNQNYKTALEWFTKAADMGSTVAMYKLGVMYYNGLGVTKDISVTLEWLEKAANHGNVYSMSILASIYEALGKSSSDKVAAQNAATKWCKKAADAGYSKAINQMGYYYYSGLGVKQNLAQAQLLFAKAANAGNVTAMYWTGWFKLENSYSTEQEINDGMAWCMKAYANGNESVGEYINTLLAQNRGVNGYFENYGELISAKP